jgi:cation diffusion facilitator CzcD-associated flavoprotein CzcO
MAAATPARFLITALGVLSAPTLPRLEGIDAFQGQAFHTARLPHRPMGFAGRRVAVIVAGAIGIRVIQAIAGEAEHLAVFRRTPIWAAPLHNRPITEEEEQREIRASYPEVFRRCRETFSCFLHTPDPRGTFEVTKEEREAPYERLYATPASAPGSATSVTF